MPYADSFVQLFIFLKDYAVKKKKRHHNDKATKNSFYHKRLSDRLVAKKVFTNFGTHP